MELLKALTSVLCAIIWQIDLTLPGTGLVVSDFFRLPCAPQLNVTVITFVDMVFTPVTSSVDGIPQPVTVHHLTATILSATGTVPSASRPTFSRLVPECCSHAPTSTTSSSSPSVLSSPQPFGSGVASALRIAKAIRTQAKISYEGVKELALANLALRVDFVKESVDCGIEALGRRYDDLKSDVRSWKRGIVAFCATQYRETDWLELVKHYGRRMALCAIISSLILCIKHKDDVHHMPRQLAQAVTTGFPPRWKVFRKKTDPWTYPLREKFGPTVDKLVETAPVVFAGCVRTVEYCIPILRRYTHKTLINTWVSLYDYVLVITHLWVTGYFTIVLLTGAVYLVAVVMAAVLCLCVWQTIYIPVRIYWTDRNERLEREWQVAVRRHYAHRCIPKLPGKTLREAQRLLQEQIDAKKPKPESTPEPKPARIDTPPREIDPAVKILQQAGCRDVVVGRIDNWYQPKVAKEPLKFRPGWQPPPGYKLPLCYYEPSPRQKKIMKEYKEAHTPKPNKSRCTLPPWEKNPPLPPPPPPKPFDWSTFNDGPNPAYKDLVRLEKTLRTLGVIQDPPPPPQITWYNNPYNEEALTKMENDFTAIKKFCEPWQLKESTEA